MTVGSRSVDRTLVYYAWKRKRFHLWIGLAVSAVGLVGLFTGKGSALYHDELSTEGRALQEAVVTRWHAFRDAGKPGASPAAAAKPRIVLQGHRAVVLATPEPPPATGAGPPARSG